MKENPSETKFETSNVGGKVLSIDHLRNFGFCSTMKTAFPNLFESVCPMANHVKGCFSLKTHFLSAGSCRMTKASRNLFEGFCPMKSHLQNMFAGFHLTMLAADESPYLDFRLKKSFHGNL